MPPRNRAHDAKPRSARHVALPRRSLIDPSSKQYNRVIRLEGQITAMIEIQRFLWRYKVCTKSTRCIVTEDVLEAGRMVYLDVVEELVREFLDRGADLCYKGHHAGDFVHMIKHQYLKALPREERRKDGLWAKIWWFMHLQRILEDESIGLAEALVRGWHWFVDAEQWPTKSCGDTGYADMWASLGAERQRRFLEGFDVNEKQLAAWMSGLPSQEFCCPNAAFEESLGLQREYSAAGVEIAVNGPWPAEEALTDGSTCPLCGEGYSLQGFGTGGPHAPILLTPCGHVFGWKCLVERTGREGTCPECGVALTVFNHPQQFIDGCDAILKWLQPPVELQRPTGPHSFLEKLMLIFEPSNSIRKRLMYWWPYGKTIGDDLCKLGDLGLYLARERMAAVVEKDVRRYREALVKQAQATAQRVWLGFVDNVLPVAQPA